MSLTTKGVLPWALPIRKWEVGDLRRGRRRWQARRLRYPIQREMSQERFQPPMDRRKKPRPRRPSPPAHLPKERVAKVRAPGRPLIWDWGLEIRDLKKR